MQFRKIFAQRTRVKAVVFATKSSREKVHIHSDSREIEKRIRDEYMRWKGIPHRWGGTERDGIDCSGSVQAVYKKIKVELPRTAKQLMRKAYS